MSDLYKLFLIGFLLIGPLITIPKLYRMAVATGKLPGRVLYQAHVTNKWTSSSQGFKYYDFSWQLLGPPGTATAQYDDRADYDDWSSMRIGSVVDVADVDGRLLCTKSIFVNKGNFEFDYILLFLEMVTWVLVIRYLLKQRDNTSITGDTQWRNF